MPVNKGPSAFGMKIPTFTPKECITEKNLESEKNAKLGVITALHHERGFGFLESKQLLPKEYSKNSFFFHFDVVKNFSKNIIAIQKGMMVKFVPYDGSFEEPKAFSVFLNEYSVGGARKKTKDKPSRARSKSKSRERQEEGKKKTNLGSKLKNKKVSIFWDIENCRPQHNTSILSVVGKIREIVLKENQVSHSQERKDII